MAVVTSRVGDLRERVIVQSKSTAPGAVSLTTVATVWAAVRPLSAGEGLQTEAVRSTVQYEVEIQYRTDVTATMKLSWTPYGGSAKTLQINGVRIAPGRPERLLLDCSEVG